MFKALRIGRARTLISIARKEWFFDIQRFSKDTQQYYQRAILAFTIDLPKKYIASITSADIRQYLIQFSWTHKNSTVNNHLVALKSWFTFLAENYAIPNIAQPIRKRKIDIPYQPFINREQYLKVLESATQRESDIIKMLANTGLRASELCGLEHISPNLSSITIQGKGGKIRTIPCNQTVREILSRSINFPKNRKSIYNICRKVGSRVGIKLAPHILRRYFATRLKDKGVSLLIISRLLGHSSIQTTEIYLCIDSSFLLGSTDCLD